MAKSPASLDEEIEFTVGKGNQSAICGGVAPMGVVKLPREDGPRAEDLPPCEAEKPDC